MGLRAIRHLVEELPTGADVTEMTRRLLQRRFSLMLLDRVFTTTRSVGKRDADDEDGADQHDEGAHTGRLGDEGPGHSDEVLQKR